MNISDDMASYMKQHRQKNRTFALELLGGKCVRCGTQDDLEFDHIDPTIKTMGIADMLAHGKDRMIEELKKCQLLCHSHHIEKTVANAETAHFGPDNPRWIEAKHGTSKMYHKYHCHCSACQQWKRDYRRGLVDSLGRPKQS